MVSDDSIQLDIDPLSLYQNSLPLSIESGRKPSPVSLIVAPNGVLQAAEVLAKKKLPRPRSFSSSSTTTTDCKPLPPRRLGHAFDHPFVQANLDNRYGRQHLLLPSNPFGCTTRPAPITVIPMLLRSVGFISGPPRGIANPSFLLLHLLIRGIIFRFFVLSSLRSSPPMTFSMLLRFRWRGIGNGLNPSPRQPQPIANAIPPLGLGHVVDHPFVQANPDNGSDLRRLLLPTILMKPTPRPAPIMAIIPTLPSILMKPIGCTPRPAPIMAIIPMLANPSLLLLHSGCPPLRRSMGTWAPSKSWVHDSCHHGYGGSCPARTMRGCDETAAVNSHLTTKSISRPEVQRERGRILSDTSMMNMIQVQS